jgi:hypothetical protein
MRLHVGVGQSQVRPSVNSFLASKKQSFGLNSYLPGGVYQGRHPITTALRSLDLQYFSPKVDYDLYWLGREEGILLVCYGSVKEEDGDDSVAFGVEQSWVLRKKEAEGDVDDM